MCIVAVCIYTVHNELELAFVEEVPGLVWIDSIWEANEEEVSANRKEDGNKAFDDEDPAPACEAIAPSGLHNAVCENATEGARDGPKHVEDRVALVDFIAGVPCAEEIHATGEKASLEHPEDDSEACHYAPTLDEAHTNHAAALLPSVCLSRSAVAISTHPKQRDGS